MFKKMGEQMVHDEKRSGLLSVLSNNLIQIVDQKIMWKRDNLEFSQLWDIYQSVRT
jgi:hypothetical protein